jgi:hypothetical protein
MGNGEIFQYVTQEQFDRYVEYLYSEGLKSQEQQEPYIKNIRIIQFSLGE